MYPPIGHKGAFPTQCSAQLLIGGIQLHGLNVGTCSLQASEIIVYSTALQMGIELMRASGVIRLYIWSHAPLLAESKRKI